MTKAIVLAAGKGTRLGELGRRTPKCLVRVGGRPLLSYTLRRLADAGVTAVVINLHHLPELVRAFVATEETFGLDVAFSPEETLLDTGGGLLRARPLLTGEGPVIVHNGDIYCEFDLARVLARHREQGALVTVVTRPPTESRVLLVDDQSRLAGWRDRATGEEILAREGANLHERGYACIIVAEQAFLDSLDGFGTAFSLVDPILATVGRGEVVSDYPADEAYWIDVGTPEKLARLDAHLRARQGD